MKNENNQPQPGTMCGTGGACSAPAWYPGFPHPASDVLEYICGTDFVVMSTVHKQVVRHDTTEVQAFGQWLATNGARDITGEAGSMVRDFYKGEG